MSNKNNNKNNNNKNKIRTTTDGRKPMRDYKQRKMSRLALSQPSVHCPRHPDDCVSR